MNNRKLNKIYNEAKLTDDDVARMPGYISGEDEFYGSEAYGKLYEYFAFEACEMPYGVAKARTGDPDSWIIDKLTGENQESSSFLDKLKHVSIEDK
tara:strand:- start:2115 stop:2402 length:288 start_codon:yes stop_codon:yes gene_type:complete